MPAALSLPMVDRKTGGQVHAGSSDITVDLAECIHDADGYYSLSFVGQPATSGAPELHSIEVKVNRPEAKVRTMTTYFADR